MKWVIEMMIKNAEKRNVIEFVSLEEMLPQDHLLRKIDAATVEYVFRWVLKAAAEEGYLNTEAIFVDGTPIKANANLKKQAKKAVPRQAKRYAKVLFDEVNKDREDHGKKPFSDDSDQKPSEEKETVVSTTLISIFKPL